MGDTLSVSENGDSIGERDAHLSFFSHAEEANRVGSGTEKGNLHLFGGAERAYAKKWKLSINRLRCENRKRIGETDVGGKENNM